MKPKTTVVKGNKAIQRQNHLIDLSGQTFGRVSTRIAALLIGKHLPRFSYHRDDGDFVTAVNAAKIVFTGRKLKQKKYRRYTGYPGGLRELSLAQLMTKDPRRVIINSVAGMLPKNRLRHRRLARLKVYIGNQHV